MIQMFHIWEGETILYYKTDTTILLSLESEIEPSLRKYKNIWIA